MLLELFRKNKNILRVKIFRMIESISLFLLGVSPIRSGGLRVRYFKTCIPSIFQSSKRSLKGPCVSGKACTILLRDLSLAAIKIQITLLQLNIKSIFALWTRP